MYILTEILYSSTTIAKLYHHHFKYFLIISSLLKIHPDDFINHYNTCKANNTLYNHTVPINMLSGESAQTTIKNGMDVFELQYWGWYIINNNG